MFLHTSSSSAICNEKLILSYISLISSNVSAIRSTFHVKCPIITIQICTSGILADGYKML